MFAEEHSELLRQGDILEKVYYIAPSFYQLRDGQISLPQNLVIRQSHLVTVSQCCDLQWYETGTGHFQPRRPYVLVAPLSLKMPFKQDSEEYSKLIQNGENRPENDPIQYFYYQDNPAIGAESVIDFSTIVPIRSSLLRDLAMRKLLELDIKHRHLFRIRLREYFSRIPDEDWDVVVQLFPEELQ